MEASHRDDAKNIGVIKMKKAKKIIFMILICITLVVAIIPYHTLAFDTSGLGELNNYKGDGGKSEAFDAIINNVIKIIQVVASIISVAVLVALGIRYMAGGVEERANYKKTMLPYVVGAFLVFGISNFTAMIYELAKKMIR